MRRLPLLAAPIAGAAAATGFAPLDFTAVLILGLAAWLWLVHAAPSLGSAMLRSWLFGVGHFTVGNNWIQHAFDFQDKMPPVLGYVGVVLLALYLAVYPMLAGGLAWKFGRSRDGRPATPFVLIAAAAWIVTEWLRARMFTGYAWNPLGVAWLPVPGIANAAAWIGTYAMSGVMVMTAGAVTLVFARRWIFAGVMVAGLALASIAANPTVDAPDPARPLVRIVQPNIGQDAVGQTGYNERVFRALLANSGSPGPAPRLLLWPEGMVNYWLEDGYPDGWYYQASSKTVRKRIAERLGPRDLAMVGGSALFFNPDLTIKGAGNSIFLVTPRATLGPRRYDKAHLVPYGEYLPMRPILSAIGLSRLVSGEIDFIPGPGPTTIDVPGFGKAALQICYEIIFSGEVVDSDNRPDFIFNPSNDGWFGAWGPPQHLAQARMRAIEEGLPVLRSTPNGISALIDADGRIIGQIPRFTAGAFQAPLPPPHPPTLFARAGNVLAFLVAGLMALTGVAIRRRTR